MGRLTTSEIERQLQLGRVHIHPFDQKQLDSNVNSYDLRLAPAVAVMAIESVQNELARWIDLCADDADAVSLLGKLSLADARKRKYVDARNPPPLVTVELTDYHAEHGFALYPGILYLAGTKEEAGADDWIPMVDGKSSLARLGLEVHKTAGFGDLGFKRKWTLEMEVTHPMLIYPDMRIAQVSFEQPIGAIGTRYKGGYSEQQGIAASTMNRYFDDDGKPK